MYNIFFMYNLSFLRVAYAVGSALCMPRAYRPAIFLDGYAGGRGRLPARLVHRYRGSGRPARPSSLRPAWRILMWEIFLLSPELEFVMDDHFSRGSRGCIHEQWVKSYVKFGGRSPKFIWVLCHVMWPAVLIGRDPAAPPIPLYWDTYTRALLVSKERRHLYVTPWVKSSLWKMRSVTEGTEVSKIVRS